MADIAFPQHKIQAYSPRMGVFGYRFTTAAAVNPSVVGGNADMILTNVVNGAGTIYTLTFKKRFTGAMVHVQLSGGADDEAVVVTTPTFGTAAACTLVLTTTKAHVASALTGPIVQVAMFILP